MVVSGKANQQSIEGSCHIQWLFQGPLAFMLATPHIPERVSAQVSCPKKKHALF